MRLLAAGRAVSGQAWWAQAQAEWGFDPVVAPDAPAVLGACLATPVDVVLCDWALPGMATAELCMQLKALPHPPAVVLLAPANGTHAAQACVDMGADDVVLTPTSAEHLHARLTLNARVVERQRTLRDHNRALRMENRRLKRLAHTDALTGLGNRRLMDRALQEAWESFHRRGEPAAVVLGDLDHFKAFNDRYGRAQGDAALQFVATTVGALLRRGDRCFRHGGQEFLVVMRPAQDAAGLALGEQLRTAVAQRALPHAGSPHGVLTLSTGLATLQPADSDVTGWLQRARAALQDAKHLGRNRCCAAGAGGLRPSPDGLACA